MSSPLVVELMMLETAVRLFTTIISPLELTLILLKDQNLQKLTIKKCYVKQCELKDTITTVVKFRNTEKARTMSNTKKRDWLNWGHRNLRVSKISGGDLV